MYEFSVRYNVVRHRFFLVTLCLDMPHGAEHDVRNGCRSTCICWQEVGLDYYLCQCPVVSREEGKPEVLSAIAGEFRR